MFENDCKQVKNLYDVECVYILIRLLDILLIVYEYIMKNNVI